MNRHVFSHYKLGFHVKWKDELLVGSSMNLSSNIPYILPVSQFSVLKKWNTVNYTK